VASPTANKPTGSKATDQNSIVQFVRKRDYHLIKELGQGACGKTVLLYDDQIQEHLVCKKYLPYSETARPQLFANFLSEIKLLHKLHHQNIVRVFNYYVYPEQFRGFILMEYIDGAEVDDYLASRPEETNEVFLQSVAGFAYLERAGILLRDIRPGNLMVREDGTVKIIDFGFGKQIKASKDFKKSISLNWWCPVPNEFRDLRYDFCSEVYFVGRLFEQIIQNNEISHFKYGDILRKMCQVAPEKRIQSFTEVEKMIGSNQFSEIDFTENEYTAYRAFAASVCRYISKIKVGAKYFDDFQKIKSQLNDHFRRFMLEEQVPDPAVVVSCFLGGTYYYNPNAVIKVHIVRDFLSMAAACTEEKGRMIIANLQTKLDAIPRYSAEPADEADDVPF
jgi:serine/threonine-protein kinase